jgi:N-acetylmuramoyl-L-alanine amidase
LALVRSGWRIALVLVLVILLGSGSGAVAQNRAVKDNLQLLAQVVCGEARHEAFEAKVGVAAVVLNRTQNSRFPDSVAGVVYQTHAFPSVRSGRFYRDTTPECYRAARMALQGADPTDGALFVINLAMVKNPYLAGRPVVRQIGGLRFAR